MLFEEKTCDLLINVCLNKYMELYKERHFELEKDEKQALGYNLVFKGVKNKIIKKEFKQFNEVIKLVVLSKILSTDLEKNLLNNYNLDTLPRC